MGGAWTLGAYQVSGAGEAPPLADVYVATAGDGTTGDGSQTTPWKSLQKALDNLAAGGTIHVAEGTYTESTRIECGKSGITICGGYTGAWDWEPETARTIINGNGNSPILHLGGANSNLFTHLTLTNGTSGSSASIYLGGEVFGLSGDASPAVRTGLHLSGEGVLMDILNKDRALKSQYDIGAYGWDLKRRRTIILVR